MDYFMLGIFEGNKSPVTNRESATSHGINVRPRKKCDLESFGRLGVPDVAAIQKHGGASRARAAEIYNLLKCIR